MSEIERLLKLDPYTFDQSEDGWRGLDNAGKPGEAARVIELYLERNHARLEKSESAKDLTHIMQFHIGQLYAVQGESHYGQALAHFQLAERPGRKGWNAYLGATIAFLERDQAALARALNQLTGIEDELGVAIANVDIVTRFQEMLGRGQHAYKAALEES